jgi:ferredoxin--NADP+ reductase
MYKILARQMLVPNMHLLKVYSPDIARKAKPGNFALLIPDEKGERIPLSISDWDIEEGSVTSIFMEVGATTCKLAQLKAGDSIMAHVGPLGLPTEIKNFGTVVCAGGCYGIGGIYPIIKALKEAGNQVISVIEARSSFLLYWEDKLKSVSDQLYVVTRDGSRGIKGHITHVLEKILKEKKVDRVIAIGCTYMMMLSAESTRPFEVKTMVSLNPIMLDGTGMCGVCRVSVGGETRFACVEGPEFDGHKVDWNDLFSRKEVYIAEEREALRIHECWGYPVNVPVEKSQPV